jgi:hypothetical protein
MLRAATDQYGDFVIGCEAVLNPSSGLYHSLAEVRGCAELHGRLAVLAPEVAPFLTAEEARAFALAYAIKWIDSGVGWSEWPESGAAPLS